MAKKKRLFEDQPNKVTPASQRSEDTSEPNRNELRDENADQLFVFYPGAFGNEEHQTWLMDVVDASDNSIFKTRIEAADLAEALRKFYDEFPRYKHLPTDTVNH